MAKKKIKEKTFDLNIEDIQQTFPTQRVLEPIEETKEDVKPEVPEVHKKDNKALSKKVVFRLPSNLIDKIVIHLIKDKTHPNRDVLLTTLLINYLDNYKVSKKEKAVTPSPVNPKAKKKTKGPDPTTPKGWKQFGFRTLEGLTEKIKLHLGENKTHTCRDVLLFELITEYFKKDKKQ